MNRPAVRTFQAALLLLTATASLGASFDCNKAATAVEKQVCSDGELSALDDEVARAYTAALARTRSNELRAVRRDQLAWLHKRNGCSASKRLCLAETYQLRISELNEYGVPLAERTWVREKPSIQPESAKLALLLKIGGSRKFTPWEDQAEHPICANALLDITAGRGFQAIEPEVRAASEADPRLERWRACDQAGESDIRDPNHPFIGLFLIGGGPIRTYRADTDGDTSNGPEDIAYNDTGGSGRNGAAGYSWIDIGGCSVRDRVTLHNLYGAPPPGYSRLSVLTHYANGTYVLVLLPRPASDTDPSEMRYQVWLTRLQSGGGIRPGCIWEENPTKR